MGESERVCEGGVGGVPLHVGGQVGRMQPPVTWVWGCVGDNENMQAITLISRAAWPASCTV